MIPCPPWRPHSVRIPQQGTEADVLRVVARDVEARLDGMRRYPQVALAHLCALERVVRDAREAIEELRSK